MAFARWCFDACIPFNAMRSPYFQPMLDAMGVLVLDIKLLPIMTCALIYYRIAIKNVSYLLIVIEANGLIVDAQLWVMAGLIIDKEL